MAGESASAVECGNLAPEYESFWRVLCMGGGLWLIGLLGSKWGRGWLTLKKGLIHLFVYLSICPSTYPFTHPSIIRHPSIHLSILSIHSSIYHASIHPFFHSFFCQCGHPSPVHLSYLLCLEEFGMLGPCVHQNLGMRSREFEDQLKQIFHGYAFKSSVLQTCFWFPFHTHPQSPPSLGPELLLGSEYDRLSPLWGMICEIWYKMHAVAWVWN